MNHDRQRQTVEAMSSRLLPIFRKHGVQRVILFGSLARGDDTRRSDLDLLVVMETDAAFLDRYDRLLPEIVREVPGRDVDLLIYTPEEFLQMASRPFIIAVLIDAVIPVKTGIQRSGHPLPAFARTGFVGVTLSHLPRAVRPGDDRACFGRVFLLPAGL